MLAGKGDAAAGVFIAEGEEWKRQRRLVITALNTNHLHRYFDVIRTATERLHRRLGDAAADGRVLQITDELTSYTVDVISTLAFGHDLNTLERGENELQRHGQADLGDDRPPPGDAGPLLALGQAARRPRSAALDRRVARCAGRVHRAITRTDEGAP